MIPMSDHSGYTILLHDELKQEFLQMPKKQKERLREKLEFLEQGIWDSGVQVKKLKGPSGKVVFEARISKGDRLIFTLGRDQDRNFIYIWAAVRHDSISSTSRKVYPANAPFLHFEPISDKPLQDLFIDDLDGQYFTQESIEDEVLEDCGPQKWLTAVDEDTWKRMLEQAHAGPFELYLHLTREQQGILDAPLPLLLSGTAGSGKTNISVYLLFKHALKGGTVLFITCSRQLRDMSSRLFEGLAAAAGRRDVQKNVQFFVLKDFILEILKSSRVPYDPKREVGFQEFRRIFSNHALARSYDAELVWEEIRSIIKGAHPPLQHRLIDTLRTSYISGNLGQDGIILLQHTLLDLKNFEVTGKISRFIVKKTPFADYDQFVQNLGEKPHLRDPSCPEILSEVVRIVSAQAKRSQAPMLTFKEYSSLGSKRAPNFIYNRNELYSIAEYYQERLDAESLYDEIDLCRKAVAVLDAHRDAFCRDTVICDEIQDFSDIQMSLIFRLAKDPMNLVCAGDPKQIINPSGFRWEELKQRFYERGIRVPQVQHLSLNFRCSGSIVDAANSLLDLKSRLVGLTSHEQRERWKFRGRPPFLIHGISESQMLHSAAGAGAQRIILVRTDEQKSKLKQNLQTELIFTVHEAKGLEFDTVLLWKFSSTRESQEIWRKISNDHHLDQSHAPMIRHEINLLYVGVTRSRNTLIIYDGPKSSHVWSVEEVNPHIYRTDDNAVLSNLWKQVSSAEEWEQQGDYFFEREYYPAALECYRNADSTRKADICRAYLLSREKNHLESARLFLASGMKQQAASEFMEARRWKDALKLWKVLKHHGNAELCRIYQMETQGSYLKAGDVWAERKEFDRALKNWIKAKAYRKAAQHYSKLKQHKEAAEYFEKDGDLLSAALSRKRAKQYGEAAQLYFQGRDCVSACALYKRINDVQGVMKCLRKMEDYHTLGIMQEKMKLYEDAAESFQAFADQSPENRAVLLKEAQDMETPRRRIKGALRYSVLNLPEKSAALFKQAALYNLAYQEYMKIPDYDEAAACCQLDEDFFTAADIYEDAGQPRKAVKALNDFIVTPRFNKQRQEELFHRGELCFFRKQYRRALSSWLACWYVDGVLRTVPYITGRDDEILEFLLDFSEYSQAQRFIEEKSVISVPLQWIDNTLLLKKHRYAYTISNGSRSEVIADLLLRLMKQDPSTEVRRRVWDFLEGLFAPTLTDGVSTKLEELILRSEHCNSLYMLMKDTSYSDQKRIEEFAARAQKRAETSENPVFKAALLGTSNPELSDSLLEGASCTLYSYRIFAGSKKHAQKAIDLLLAEGRFLNAVFLLKEYGRFQEAAALYEECGELRKAGILYRDHGYWDQALRIFTSMNSQDGIARVYERKGEFDKALNIWKDLGRRRDIARVEKLIYKKQEYRQQELF